VRIPYELEIFDGHFPAVPIVPGVIQIGWAVELGRQHLHVTGRFKGIGTAKFRRLVQPGMQLDLRLQYLQSAGQLRFEYSSQGAAVSLGRVHFAAGHE
jgi:3-hydroxymyristoyl/3-hydroxydecanoyl-(acyl carrier protein) dehydratase